MKLSFPYMGEATIAYQKIATMLGHELIAPQKPTQNTVNLGVKYAPEFACFPLKVLLGTYLESIEAGADTIMSSGGSGPCRAGYYGELHKKVLESLGYNTRIIILEGINQDPKRFFNDLLTIKGKNSWKSLWFTLKTVYQGVKLLDQTEQEVCRLRPYEIKKGSVNKVWEHIIDLVDQAFSPEDMQKVKKSADELLKEVPIRKVAEENIYRIGIIGEIYVVLENSVNMQMEEKINELGCEVRRSQYLSDWIDFHIIPQFISKPHEAKIKEMGKEFFPISIGGHAQENMGWVKQYHEWGYDGIVHLLPFGCLPELMSQSIIPQISHDYDLPIISFPLDEQSGLANNLTRLEAFIDLVRAKRKSKSSAQRVV